MPTISTLTVDVEANTHRFSTGLKVATAGLAALGAGAIYAFRQFEEADKVAAQTDATLRSTGGAANVTAQQIADLAGAISAKSAVDDEAIQSGENLLLTFTNIRNEVGRGNDIFNQATQVMTDMSVALGQDFKSSAIQLGKALNDPIAGITALQRVGVSFTAQTKERIAALVAEGNTLKAQKIILAELTTEFGGSAEAGRTSSAALSVAFGNLVETIGGLLAPALQGLLDAITPLIAFIQENAGPAFQAVAEWLGRVWERVEPVARAFGEELMEALTQTWDVIKTRVWPALKDLWDALQPVLRVVGLVAAAIIKLALEAFPYVVEAIGIVIGWLADLVAGFTAVVDFVRDHFVDPIVGAIEHVITWVSRAVTWVKERFLGAWNTIKGPVLAVIDAISSAVETLIGWVRTAYDVLLELVTLGQANTGTFNGTGPVGGGDPTTSGGFHGSPPPINPRLTSATARGSLSPVIINNGVMVGTTTEELARVIDAELSRQRRRNGTLALDQAKW